MSYRNTPGDSSGAYNMTNPGYSSYSYPDPAAAYYQQPVLMNNGSVSPDGNYATSYANPATPLVGMDDPTQPRRYVTASTTSRKEVPGYFSRRQPQNRAPSIPSDEEDELMEEPPAANATDQEKIEYKRRQNTLAARRSRRRKMQYTQNLAETVERLKMEKEVWKTRALTLKQLLHSHGVACPDFPE
ncbi:hypothetical protein CPB85DRAFT_1331081 [Mucidula mucida]|nr:hypothetical protein CPB85DRAFT_1331081 [Mucidula mucida]